LMTEGPLTVGLPTIDGGSTDKEHLPRDAIDRFPAPFIDPCRSVIPGADRS
jgi:hypothetical protein